MTELPLREHFRELRKRLSWLVLIVLVGTVIAYLFRTQLIVWLSKPLNLPLFYSNPSGGLQFVFGICFAFGVVFALPFAIYNFVRFLEPAFEKKLSKKKIFFTTLVSTLLAAIGAFFAYYVMLPLSFKFFSDFNIGGIQPLISTKEYLSFTTLTMVVFALIFQIPLLLLFFNSINNFPTGKLRKYRKHTYVGSLIFALILPFTYDPVTQFIVAVPIVILYELSLIAIWGVNFKKNRMRKILKEYSLKNIHNTEEEGLKAHKQVDDVRPIQLG